MEINETIASLRALAHASRLAAFRALVQAGADGMPVGVLRDLLQLAPATLTAHLNVLRAAGLVVDRREGRVIRLRADYARMYALIGYLTDNCCGGVSCKPAAAKPARARAKPAPRDARAARSGAARRLR
ncbi:MAG TPA: helix-turn-helix domain-containing protein [Dokdonella sp.]